LNAKKNKKKYITYLISYSYATCKTYKHSHLPDRGTTDFAPSLPLPLTPHPAITVKI
jgi:hypothetical protein